MTGPYLYDSLGHQMEWRPPQEPITVHNVHGLRDNVITLVEPERYGSCFEIDPSKPMFCCGECNTPVHQVYPKDKMYVDSEGIVWCPQCYRSSLERTVRSMKKADQDPHPKIYHKGGNYYQRLKRLKRS